VIPLILLFFLNNQVITNVTAQTRYTDSTLVIRTAGLKPGDQFSKLELAQGVRRLYQLHLFETIDVDTTRLADAVSVKFIVKEFPVLKDIKFFGNRKIKAKDFIEKTNIKLGEIASDQKLFDWQTKIEELYKEKGYILAKINIQQSEPDSTNRVNIIFQIDEGERVRIKRIEILGNFALSDKQIKRKFTNKEKAWYRKGLFKEDKFKDDLDKVVEVYKDHGYLNAKVEDYDLHYDETTGRQWLYITIKVSEGQKYYIGNISFEGDSLIARDKITEVIRIKTGQVYNAKKVQQNLVDLYSLYSEEGFIYASITPIEDINQDTVNIRYQIGENNPARIRLVLIEGNERTQDRIIRRQISSLPNSIFKRSDVLRSQRDIFNLGFFDDVKLDYKRANELGDIDLVYQVKEKSSFGTIGAGVQYSATDKLTGYLELSQPNLFGRGQKFSIKVEKGSSKTNVQLGFNEPYLFERNLSAGLNLTYLTTTYDYYSKQEEGIDISLARPLPLDYSRIYLGVNFSGSKVPGSSISSSYTPTSVYSVYRDTIHRTTFSPIISFIRDSRDYIYNPLSGSMLSYSAEMSTIDVFYHRHILDASVYFPMFNKFTLMFRSRLGFIEGFRARDTIPIYERFYPGGTGADGIRGYGDRSLGVNVGGYNIGGKAEAIYSTEFKFRPSPQLAFLVFLDAGNTWNTFRDMNISNLKRGAGVGVRLEVPMLGLMGFDFGYGFDREGGGKWEPHFQIGRTF